MNIDSVNWSRVAEPQADGYDTGIVLGFAELAGFRRRPPSNEPTMLDGAVALRQDPALLGYDGCQYAASDHPNIATADRLLRLWPAVYRQCGELLDSICIYDYPRMGGDMIIGSVCGSGSSGFGSIVVTVNHHMGLAEGIVHEMAHHKLRALGVDMESATMLITNDPSEVYPSPIRYDCLRPMTAVLHAQYSYLHILQLDLMVLEHDSHPLRAAAIREQSLAVIAPKLEFGLQTIQQAVQTDAYGDDFIQGMVCWCECVIECAYADLKSNDVMPHPFLHPVSGTHAV